MIQTKSRKKLKKVPKYKLPEPPKYKKINEFPNNNLKKEVIEWTITQWINKNGWWILAIIIVLAALIAFNVIPIDKQIRAWKVECYNETNSSKFNVHPGLYNITVFDCIIQINCTDGSYLNCTFNSYCPKNYSFPVHEVCQNISVKTIDVTQICSKSFNCVPEDIKILKNISVTSLTKDYLNNECKILSKNLWNCSGIYIQK